MLSLALAQNSGTTPACSADLASSDDCADVIDPIACYNEMGFRGSGTLQCIDGKNNTDRARKVRRAKRLGCRMDV
jgi:hypothetical protein